MTIEQRIATVTENLTDTNAALMQAVEDAMMDEHDSTSAIELSARVRQLQSEQNAWIAEALGIMADEAGIEEEPWRRVADFREAAWYEEIEGRTR